MNHELDPNQRPKEIGELREETKGIPKSDEVDIQIDEERSLETVKGTELPVPSSQPELGDIKYGK